MSDRKGTKANEQSVRLTDEQRIDWLRLIRSQNVGPVEVPVTTTLRMGFRSKKSARCRLGL